MSNIKIDKNIFAAGCYNGSGIGVGTLFGEQIALKASNENTKEIEHSRILYIEHIKGSALTILELGVGL